MTAQPGAPANAETEVEKAYYAWKQTSATLHYSDAYRAGWHDALAANPGGGAAIESKKSALTFDEWQADAGAWTKTNNVWSDAVRQAWQEKGK